MATEMKVIPVWLDNRPGIEEDMGWAIISSYEPAPHRKIVPARLVLGEGKIPQWISVEERLPEDRQKVIAGHATGKWVYDDILYKDGGFRMRVNGMTGGVAEFKQKDWKKENGDPAGPDEWAWGPECFPTHWMELPDAPPLTP